MHFVNGLIGINFYQHAFLAIVLEYIFFAKLSPYLKPSHRLLEIGSGPGYFLASIRDHVAEIQGIELNRQEARYAREVHGIPTSDRPHESGDGPKEY